MANSSGREKQPRLSGGMQAHLGGIAPLLSHAPASCLWEGPSSLKGRSDLWFRVAWKNNAGPFVGGVPVPSLGGILETCVHD